MQNEKQYITSEGMEKLRQELHHLKNVVHPEVVQHVQEGRAHGDLRENAEYQTAREKQSYVEGQIMQLEQTIQNLEPVDVSKIPQDGKVYFGSNVEILDLKTNQISTIQIVGEKEANFELGKISATSPLGRSLIGKEVGDVAYFTAPAGKKEYEIISIPANKSGK